MNKTGYAALCVLLAMLLSLAAIAQDTSIVPTAPAGKGIVVLKAARLIDGTGRPAIHNGVIVVTDNLITAVGTSDQVQIPAGARVIDLGDATLMPGFVDAHTHVIGRILGDPAGDSAPARDYQSFGAIIGTRNANNILLAGFPSIPNFVLPNFYVKALRKALNDGFVPGPRIMAAGYAIGITGGHCDENGYRPGLLDRGPERGIANGPEEVRTAVRNMVKYGADVIKVCATGGVLSEGDAVGATQYTFEEMKALVDEAHKLDRKVAAHAHGTEGIKIAVRAGVNSIEHGSFMDEEAAKMMTERGTYLVPTLMAGESVERMAKNGVLKGLRAEKALAAAAAMRNGIKIAKRNGVKIALGTDSSVIPHGTNGHEFTLMVEWGGLTSMESIIAGTMGGATLLGWDKKIGSLEVGKWADITAVLGDPLVDIHKMESTVFVMKNGVIYKQ